MTKSLRYMETPPYFPPFYRRKPLLLTSCFLPSLKKEVAPRGANLFHEEVSLNEKGGKNVSSRAVSPESVAIHLYWIFLFILHFGQFMCNQVFFFFS